MRTCQNCGDEIEAPWNRCYPCHAAFRAAGGHDPEHLPHHSAMDRMLGRSVSVYALTTATGNYVGHTANLKARIAAHRNDEVPSTQGLHPRLAWVSRPFRTREDAARFEAALKSWNDNCNPRFTEVTGIEPDPFFFYPEWLRGEQDDIVPRGGKMFIGITAFICAFIFWPDLVNFLGIFMNRILQVVAGIV